MCQDCGLTDEEHQRKWSRQITVDHIDGNGRHKLVGQKNNKLSNLRTLCLSCHGKKDVVRRTKNSNKWIKLRETANA